MYGKSLQEFRHRVLIGQRFVVGNHMAGRGKFDYAAMRNCAPVTVDVRRRQIRRNGGERICADEQRNRQAQRRKLRAEIDFPRVAL